MTAVFKTVIDLLDPFPRCLYLTKCLMFALNKFIVTFRVACFSKFEWSSDQCYF